MTANYPIVTEKTLGPAKRGGHGWGRRRRAEGEVPPAKGEHVRVFLVEGKHIVDHGRRDDYDDQVVRASHVAIVDLSRNVEVSVRFDIPSQDAHEFTVQATFLCTVTDPVAVVRNGQGDASRALLGYVRSHQRLFQLGLEHRVSAINQVRVLVQTQIEAYVQLRPPLLPGLEAGLASVDVLTPITEREKQGRLSEQDDEHTIEAHGLNLQHEMNRLKEEHARQMQIAQTKHETQMEEMRLILQEQAQRTMAARAQFMDDDPLRATIYAEAQGELSATDVADKVQEQVDRQAAQVRDEVERQRQVEDEDRAWMRQRADREYETRHQVELTRLEHFQALEGGDREHGRAMIERTHAADERERDRAHELTARTLELEAEKSRLDHEANQAKLRLLYEARAAEREHRHAVADRDHQAAIDREIREHERRRDLLEARLAMFKEYAARGHVDQAVISAHEVLEGLATDPAPAVAADRPPAALPDAGPGPAEADDEPTLREEGT
ncbi:hypothetical protein [Actinomadura roseirufa]|uniref:hypothetical protein n=1 Tax=Actinomadura roseirufa TaxID=2094049 RepID=UPI0010410718|nr:hypothetical protein [Actinomadura roseirufa]